jgi:hypothetical protein
LTRIPRVCMYHELSTRLPKYIPVQCPTKKKLLEGGRTQPRTQPRAISLIFYLRWGTKVVMSPQSYHHTAWERQKYYLRALLPKCQDKIYYVNFTSPINNIRYVPRNPRPHLHVMHKDFQQGSFTDHSLPGFAANRI